jgi:hypothetical protein
VYDISYTIYIHGMLEAGTLRETGFMPVEVPPDTAPADPIPLEYG